ncbi:MAG: hypothetical protein ACJ75H_14230 [Thermoanaerobaculia bacterium]
MPDYSVTFLIDAKDLEAIKGAQQRITLAKTVNGDNNANVIWLSIDPFPTTEVGWDEAYGIYASASGVVDGTTITKMSETGGTAQDRAYYTFTSAAAFNGPYSGNGVPAGSYGVQNDMPYTSYASLTFGLTQDALVNGQKALAKPVSATVALATQFVQMSPSPTLYVWLQAQFVSGTVIKVSGKSTKVTLGAGVTSTTLKYDPSLGLFVAASPQKMLVSGRPTVELFHGAAA